MTTRISKRPSPKQRAHIERIKRNGGAGRALPRISGPPASTAWWLGLSRHELQERARRERLRIEYSRFGRIHSSGAIQE